LKNKYIIKSKIPCPECNCRRWVCWNLHNDSLQIINVTYLIIDASEEELGKLRKITEF